MTGTLYGIGVGPGDPELMTLKAVRLLATVPVIAWPAPLEGDGLARTIAAGLIPAGRVEIAIRMGFAVDRAGADAAYDQGAARIAAELEQGRDVAVLCEGDPFFFGSFIYLFGRLAGRFPIEVVPGVSSPMTAAAAAGRPLAAWDDALAVIPATRGDAEIERLLEAVDAAVIMKVGRHLGRLCRLLERLGLAGHACIVERASHPDQRILGLAEAESSGVSYFSIILVHRRGEPWR